METMKRKCFGSTKLFKVSRMFIISCQRREAKENKKQNKRQCIADTSISVTSPYVPDVTDVHLTSAFERNNCYLYLHQLIGRMTIGL